MPKNPIFRKSKFTLTSNEKIKPALFIIGAMHWPFQL